MIDGMYKLIDDKKVFVCMVCHDELIEKNSSEKYGCCLKCEDVYEYLKTHPFFENRCRKKLGEIKGSAKAREIFFNIKIYEFIKWVIKQKDRCSYCGLSLEEAIKFNAGMKNFSIDRIDNNKGYELDNICFACNRCNNVKSNVFSAEEMIKIGKSFEEIYRKKLIGGKLYVLMEEDDKCY